MELRYFRTLLYILVQPQMATVHEYSIYSFKHFSSKSCICSEFLVRILAKFYQDLQQQVKYPAKNSKILNTMFYVAVIKSPKCDEETNFGIKFWNRIPYFLKECFPRNRLIYLKCLRKYEFG